MLNPRFIKWTAPTQRTDGSALDQDGLAYNMYIDGAPVATFPGTLNAEGRYEQAFADLAWEPAPGRVHILTLTAVETLTGLESMESNSVEVQFAGNPMPPVNVEAL